jgi:hypothetical protein
MYRRLLGSTVVPEHFGTTVLPGSFRALLHGPRLGSRLPGIHESGRLYRLEYITIDRRD